MNRNELYTRILEMAPVKVGEKEGYRDAVKRSLKTYKKLLGELDDALKPATWNNTVGRVNQLCDGINRAIEREYQGMRHSAYASIKNQLDGYKTQKNNIQGLAYDKNVLSIPAGMVSYRMRKVDLDEQHNLKRKDLFHIPFDKKGLVQTQRYSVPGYPCLYLSHGVYGCWEEMGRPVFGTIMVSKFVSQQEFKVLDLRIPSREAWDADIEKCVEFYPLVIASMVQVKNGKDNYKPEYLIPQLLTEWVITHNRDNTPDNEIIGILFTSSRKNKDFDYPNDCYDNYAIPVLKPLGSKKYCDRLTELFHLSAPTYYDLEVLKQGEIIDGGILGQNEDERKAENYRTSHFGVMERYLEGTAVEEVQE